jgi:hypothetical protein
MCKWQQRAAKNRVSVPKTILAVNDIVLQIAQIFWRRLWGQVAIQRQRKTEREHRVFAA